MTKKKLDLFGIIRRLDLCDTTIYQSMEDQDRKELESIVGYLLPRWMTGAYDDAAHMALVAEFNENCNDGWYGVLHKYPEIQTKLLAACGLGQSVKHRFFKEKRGKDTSKLRNLLQEKYPHINDDEIRLWVQKNSGAVLGQMARDNGIQKDELVRLVEEYNQMKELIDGN